MSKQIRARRKGRKPNHFQALMDPVLFAEKFLNAEVRHYQKKFLRSKEQKRMVTSIRRGGKTEVIALDIAYHLLTEPCTRILLVAPDKHMAAEVFHRVHRYIERAFPHRITRYVHAPFMELQLDSGTRLRAFSGWRDGFALCGQDADHIYLEEAASLTDNTYQPIHSIMRTSANCRLTLVTSPRGITEKYHYCANLWNDLPEESRFHWNHEVVHGDMAAYDRGIDFRDFSREVWLHDFMGEWEDNA